MSTYSNRLPMTQVSFRKSVKTDEEANGNAPNCDESGYIVRSEDELSKVEHLYLDSLNDNPKTQKLVSMDFGTLYKGPKAQLESWPLFFRSKEESGIELQQGVVTQWSNYLIAEILMASISIQPLVTVPDIPRGWKFKLYGYIWTMSVISDFWGIALTALCLGYVLGCPNKVVWNWMCEIGWLRSVPSILVLYDATLTLAAIAYTCWILYGYQMGIVTVVVEVFFVGSFLKLADVLGKAGAKVTC